MSNLAASVRDVIETRFRDVLGAWIPVTFDAVTYEPEESGGALRELWARVTILYGDAFEATMGPEDVGENMLTGVVIIDVFGRPGLGAGPLLEKADEARVLFNSKTIGDIEFGPSSGPGVPREDREGWLHVAVRTAFEVHEVT
jgi:hypothetical protein